MPAKQRPEVMPTSGTSPLSRAEEVERQAVEAGHAGAVGVAGPAAAALGEEHDGQALALGQLEQPVLLAVVLQALRAGEHGVVVGHHDRPGWPSTRADAADQAVGRRALDQLLERRGAGAARR